MTEAEKNSIKLRIGEVGDPKAQAVLSILFDHQIKLERKWLDDRRKLRNLQQFARRGAS